jgi:hypothetical protein
MIEDQTEAGLGRVHCGSIAVTQRTMQVKYYSNRYALLDYSDDQCSLAADSKRADGTGLPRTLSLPERKTLHPLRRSSVPSIRPRSYDLSLPQLPRRRLQQPARLGASREKVGTNGNSGGWDVHLIIAASSLLPCKRSAPRPSPQSLSRLWPNPARGLIKIQWRSRLHHPHTPEKVALCELDGAYDIACLALPIRVCMTTLR